MKLEQIKKLGSIRHFIIIVNIVFGCLTPHSPLCEGHLQNTYLERLITWRSLNASENFIFFGPLQSKYIVMGISAYLPIDEAPHVKKICMWP